MSFEFGSGISSTHTHTHTMTVRISTRRPIMLTDIIHGFPQSLQANAAIVSYNRPLPYLLHPFQFITNHAE
jgi:hypothetical protein